MSAEDRLQTLEQIREAVLASEAPIPGGDLEAFWRLLGGSLALSLEDKEKLAGSLDKLGAEGLRDLVRTLEEEAVFYNDLVRDPVVCDELADAVRGGRMSGIRDVRGARELAQESGSPRIEVVSRMFACERWPDPAAIEREYRALIALDPDYVLPWKKLGDLVLKMGKLDAAEPLYRKAIALDFGYALPRKKLADLLMGLERFEESEKYYRQAISLDPDYARSWHNLGLLMARTDRLEEAEEACREASPDIMPQSLPRGGADGQHLRRRLAHPGADHGRPGQPGGGRGGAAPGDRAQAGPPAGRRGADGGAGPDGGVPG